MLLNRRIFKIKVGCMDTAADMAKAELEALGAQGTVASSDFGENYVLSVDIQFENLTAYEKFWTDWFGSPRAEAFFETWNTLVERDGANELWVIR